MYSTQSVSEHVVMHAGHMYNNNNFGKFFFEKNINKSGGNVLNNTIYWERLSLPNEVLFYNILGNAQIG